MIKRLLLKVGLMLGGLFFVMLVMPGPGGKPLMAVSDLPGYGLFTAANKAIDTASETVDDLSGSNEIYTWTDENGAIHYSDKPINGASVHKLSATNDAIPSDNFTGEAFNTRRESTQKARSFKIGDSSRSGKSGGKSGGEITADDFQSLAEGDFGNAREVLKQLPDYLQKQHQQRTEILNQL